MKLCLALLLCGVGALFAEDKIELGEINGAKFRIDVPEKWNGGLVMYCHGYNPKPATYNDRPNPLAKVFLDQGYAVAQSGYAAGGWAIQEGVVDTENLRRYFVKKYGPVKETYVTGHSMGGFITMTLMETHPTTYDAGMPLCGPLAAPVSFMARGAFDGLVLFNYYFPGVLPEPNKVPADYVGGNQVSAKIEAALASDEAKAAVLRAQNGNKSNKDLAGVLSFVTYIVKEITERAGGFAFDNRNVIYNHTPDDNAVNAGVKRYAADAKAVEYLRTYYTPTGRIQQTDAGDSHKLRSLGADLHRSPIAGRQTADSAEQRLPCARCPNHLGDRSLQRPRLGCEPSRLAGSFRWMPISSPLKDSYQCQ